ncbi:F-box protein CPR1, partial [Bienertia sinuspersici]
YLQNTRTVEKPKQILPQLYLAEEIINLHLHQCVSSNTNRFLITFNYKKGGNQKLYLLDLDSPGYPAHYLQLPPPSCDKHCTSLEVVGSCNGLICLKYTIIPFSNKNITLFIILNPTTGEICANISIRYDWATRCYGFGYDSWNDDYKLVFAEYEAEDSYVTTYHTERKVLVYSLRFDSLRCIKENVWLLFNNNLLHWLHRSQDEKRRIIACFNLENEQWTTDVPLPDFDDYDYDPHFNDYNIKLGNLHGCLCLSIIFQGNIDFLIMKEYGVQDSWTKLV